MRPRGVGEARVSLGGYGGRFSRQDADRVTGQTTRLANHASWLGQRHRDAVEKQACGWNTDGLASLDDPERLFLVAGHRGWLSRSHAGAPTRRDLTADSAHRPTH